jgi:Beta-lactamase
VGERKDVPGVVGLLTDRRGVLYQGAFGVADVSTGRALTADALFRIASMTKAVTSVAVMQLIEQGRFGLDDSVENAGICRPEGIRIVRCGDRHADTDKKKRQSLSVLSTGARIPVLTRSRMTDCDILKFLRR